MAISQRLRYEILRRDNHMCRYCGVTAAEVKLTVDHVVPKALGGNDDPSNLAAACQPCNAGKAATNPDAPLVADVKQDALRWGRAMKLAAEARQANRAERDAYVAAFEQRWDEWLHGGRVREEGIPFEKPGNWRASIWRFYELSLPIEDLRDCVTLACSNERISPDQAFKYMCGCAWRIVDELRQAAAEIAAAEGD